jgi:hypothetical protein
VFHGVRQIDGGLDDDLPVTGAPVWFLPEDLSLSGAVHPLEFRVDGSQVEDVLQDDLLRCPRPADLRVAHGGRWQSRGLDDRSLQPLAVNVAFGRSQDVALLASPQVRQSLPSPVDAAFLLQGGQQFRHSRSVLVLHEGRQHRRGRLRSHLVSGHMQGLRRGVALVHGELTASISRFCGDGA